MKKETKVAVTASAHCVRVLSQSIARCNGLETQFNNAQKTILDTVEADIKALKLHYENADNKSRSQFKKSVYKALFGLKKNAELSDTEKRVYNALKKRYEKLGIVKKQTPRKPAKRLSIDKPEIETSKATSLEDEYGKLDALLNDIAKKLGLARADVWKHRAAYLVTIAKD